jgi:hypothetical protein
VVKDLKNSPDMGTSFFEKLIEIVPCYFLALNIVAMVSNRQSRHGKIADAYVLRA